MITPNKMNRRYTSVESDLDWYIYIFSTLHFLNTGAIMEKVANGVDHLLVKSKMELIYSFSP